MNIDINLLTLVIASEIVLIITISFFLKNSFRKDRIQPSLSKKYIKDLKL